MKREGTNDRGDGRGQRTKETGGGKGQRKREGAKDREDGRGQRAKEMGGDKGQRKREGTKDKGNGRGQRTGETEIQGQRRMAGNKTSLRSFILAMIREKRQKI